MRKEMPLPAAQAGLPPVLVLGGDMDLLLDEPAIHETAKHYGVDAVIMQNMAHDCMLVGSLCFFISLHSKLLAVMEVHQLLAPPGLSLHAPYQHYSCSEALPGDLMYRYAIVANTWFACVDSFCAVWGWQDTRWQQAADHLAKWVVGQYGPLKAE